VKNLGTVDRLMRVILAEACILVAFFWVAVDWQIPLYLIGIVMLFQAATGTCGLYSLLGWNSCERIKRRNKNLMATFAALALLLAVAGSYMSITLTNDIYRQDVTALSGAYSLALQSSDRGEVSLAADQNKKLQAAFESFEERYSKYRPMAIKFDGNFSGEMNRISEAISSSQEGLEQGNLTGAHLKLLGAEPAIRALSL